MLTNCGPITKIDFLLEWQDMAMEGTHLRFALDLKEKLRVTDEKAYLLGAVYPDSRYMTKIDRKLTHPKNYKEIFLDKSDFYKGWFTHLLCDEIQGDIIYETFPDIGDSIPGQNSEEWINRTSIKLLQDLEDIKQFDVKRAAYSLDSTKNPNDEDNKVLERYNRLLQAIYEKPGEVNLDSYNLLWKEFELNDELGKKLMKKAHEDMKDSEFVEKVKGIYGKVLERSIEKLS
ncbi:hypothetical protein N9L18_00220 [Candidatus Pacebacteria bacterium]|nr:hypothetical protein [Candidatus Paceibacterota bacterium]